MKMASLVSASVLVVTAFGMAACTVTVKTQTKYRSQNAITLASTATWGTQAIEIENANGNVRVVGDPAATKVTASYVPFAFADTQADGDAAVEDVKGTFGIEEAADRIYVRCGQARSSHGSAKNGTTGCDDLTITVPAGSATAGLKLKAVSHNGSVDASNLTAAAGQQLLILSDNGSVTATNITGGVKAHTENGSATGSFTPTAGASLELSTGNGDAELSLPSDFAAVSLALTSKGKVSITGFSDLTATSTSRNPQAANAAASIVLASPDLGDVTLTSR